MPSQRMIIRSTWVLASGAIASAHAQTELFNRDYGGTRADGAFAVEATQDGGFVAAGFSESVSPNSRTAAHLVKTDTNGELEWSRIYELSDIDNFGAAVRVLPDGGYAIAGRAGNNGNFDSFLIRTDENGDALWERTYDAGNDDRAHALALTSDGGFIIAGQAWFVDGNFGNYDMYVVKTDANGNEQWRTTFEHADGFGAGADIAFAIEQVSTGGYIIAGYTQSNVWDGWVIRIDEFGSPIWDRLYSNGGGSDEMTSIRELDDGGFILGGMYANNSGDVDLALVRTDDVGVPIWTRIFGDPIADDQGRAVRVMPDGGFLLAGFTASYGEGGWDMYLVRTDANGVEIWSETQGGTSDDRAWSVAIGADKIVAAGWAWSSGAGRGDVHLVAYDDPALSCAADLDGDGDADADDFFSYLDLFASGDPASDIDGDGDTDADDFFGYLDLFATGC